MRLGVFSLGDVMESLITSDGAGQSQIDRSPQTTVATVLQMQTKSLLKNYGKHLAEQDLSVNTTIAYRYAVSGFLRWIGAGLSGCFSESNPFVNCVARDRAVSEYKRSLKDKGAKRASINAALTAIDHFYQFLGLGKSSVSRE